MPTSRTKRSTKTESFITNVMLEVHFKTSDEATGKFMGTSLLEDWQQLAKRVQPFASVQGTSTHAETTTQQVPKARRAARKRTARANG